MSEETTKPNGSSNRQEMSVETTSGDALKMSEFNFKVGYMFFEPDYNAELVLDEMLDGKALRKNTKVKTSKTLIVSFNQFIESILNGNNNAFLNKDIEAYWFCS